MNKLTIVLLLFIASCTVKREKLTDIPETLPKFEMVIENKDLFEGFILLRKTVAPGAQVMINSSADIVWYQLSDTAIFRPFSGYENSYIALYNNDEIHELSYSGDTLWNLKYGEKGLDKYLHHEVIVDSEDNIVALTKEKIEIDLSELGGISQDSIITDGIIKLNRKGEKLWYWSLDQVLDPLSDSTILNKKHDWGHANALYEDDDGNYLISWRDFDEIWKINSQTGELMWKYGNEDIEDQQNYFYKQHTITRSIDGDYLFFDNGHKKGRPSSKAVFFRKSGDKFEQTNAIVLPDSLFSSKQGSVYEYQKDRFLFSSPMNKYLVITNTEGDILWMAKTSEQFYRAEYVSNF